MELKKKLTLLELKQMISTVDGSQSSERRAFSKYENGFVRGKMVEIVGAGKTEFISEFIKEHSKLKILWIEKELTINPYGLWQRGIDLSQITFIETTEAGWAAQQVAESAF